MTIAAGSDYASAQLSSPTASGTYTVTASTSTAGISATTRATLTVT